LDEVVYGNLTSHVSFVTKYFGAKVESSGQPGQSPFAMDETLYKPEEVERIARSAAHLAHTIANELPSAVGPKLECKVTSVGQLFFSFF
jgi:hypothetical protein